MRIMPIIFTTKDQVSEELILGLVQGATTLPS